MTLLSHQSTEVVQVLANCDKIPNKKIVVKTYHIVVIAYDIIIVTNCLCKTM